MLMNYHEMTMSEARDSPQRRKQFLVICTVMASFLAHSVITSGGLSSVDIKEGIFPGGQFVYKSAGRDYAASQGLMRHIGKDLELKPREYPDLLYSLYLDNPWEVGGRRQRFASGILVDNRGKDMKKKLLDMNPSILAQQKGKDLSELPAFELWPATEYESTSLPSLDAAVANFPFTNGFVSALILSYKVIPALRKYAEENGEAGNVPVVLTTCSEKEQMCTHYAPLLRGNKFLLGKPESKEYVKSFEEEKWVDWNKAMKGLRKMFPPLKYLGL